MLVVGGEWICLVVLGKNLDVVGGEGECGE